MLLSSNSDIELVELPSSGRIFAFTVLDVLELKELLSGTFTMLELNSLIHRQVVRKSI
jgi:hypothetical protein